MGVELGYEVLDIGKTSPTDEGLLKYKSHWGAAEMEVPHFYYPRVMGISSLDDEKSLLYRTMAVVWRRMPPVLAQLAARVFYRHAG